MPELAFNLDEPILPKAIASAAMTSGDYPYEDRYPRKAYEKELEALQIELVKLQAHLEDSGERVIVVFEGRDAAGKGGTIKRFREHMSPRRVPIVALPKPTDRQRGQWYYQRYVEQFPTAGEMVLFDRSWYNRGVVEPVMGFCTPEENEQFLDETPGFERQITRHGLKLFKFWLNIGREMQMKRFHDRRHDPLKGWKISPVDLAAIDRWDDYTKARDKMIEATHTDHAPWMVIRANDKRRARLNAIRTVLLGLNYPGKSKDAIGDTDPKIVGPGMDLLD
ncbi:MAG: polyphosphate kinase 2 [Pseudomonadota bacterium]